MQILPGVVFANQMNLVTLGAFLEGVIVCERIPVFPLIGGQRAGSLAKGADVVQCGHYCPPDKLRTVGDSLHSLQQRFVNFEGNDFIFAFSHFERLYTENRQIRP